MQYGNWFCQHAGFRNYDVLFKLKKVSNFHLLGRIKKNMACLSGQAATRVPDGDGVAQRMQGHVGHTWSSGGFRWRAQNSSGQSHPLRLVNPYRYVNFLSPRFYSATFLFPSTRCVGLSSLSFRRSLSAVVHHAVDSHDHDDRRAHDQECRERLLLDLHRGAAPNPAHGHYQGSPRGTPSSQFPPHWSCPS